MKAIPANLNPLIELLALYLERRVDHFTMQCNGGSYVHGPYVQALQEHDNMVLIEVTSNKFLEPKLSKESQQKLQFLGWNQYVPCLLYTSPSPRDRTRSRMPSSA